MKQGLPGTSHRSLPQRVSTNPVADVPTWQEYITKASRHIAPFNCTHIAFAERHTPFPSRDRSRAPQRVYVRARLVSPALTDML